MSKGGVFNCAQTAYSEKTCQILKGLMQEAKLSMIAQKELGCRMLTGAPLPPPRIKSGPPVQRSQNLFGTKKNYYFSKRKLNQIERAGAYSVDLERPFHPRVDREKEKEILQNRMAFGTKDDPTKSSVKLRRRAAALQPTPSERIDELAVEIEERVTFLEEMTALGQGSRYRHIIKQEIASKLSEIEDLQKLNDI